MSDIYSGKNLANCFSVASRAYIEINNLAELLDNTIIKNLGKVKNKRLLPKTKFKEFTRGDDSGWTFSDIARSVGVIGQRKRKPNMFLGYQVSLLGDGMALMEEPVVHFFYWSNPVDFNENWIGFPFDMDSEFKIKNNYLIYWGNSLEMEWMFSIKLISITNESDVERIVQAVVSLIEDESSTKYSELPGLVTYVVKESSLKCGHDAEKRITY